MAYDKQTWTETTPVSPGRLQHIEDGIAAESVPALVDDTIVYNVDGTVQYAIAGGIRTDYTWNSDGTCHTEESQGLLKTWNYDGSGNPISSNVTEV